MKRVIVGVVCCMFVAGPLLAEPQVTLQETAGYRAPLPWDGGEITVLVGSGWGSYDPTQLYVDSPGDGTRNVGTTSNSFETFCIERSESVGFGPSYEVSIGEAAVFDGSAPGGSDPISMGTSWLYEQFATGNLSGYDYTAGSGREADAKDLQNAFWILEDEQSGTIAGWLQTALTAGLSSASLSDWKADHDGRYGTKVMSLWEVGHVGEAGYEHQDVLILVPVPAAAVLGFLGFAVAGMKLRKIS